MAFPLPPFEWDDDEENNEKKNNNSFLRLNLIHKKTKNKYTLFLFYEDFFWIYKNKTGEIFNISSDAFKNEFIVNIIKGDEEK